MLNKIKASQLALDGGSFISKILQLEKECAVEFEHMHVKTSSEEELIGYDYERKLVLESDRKAKEIREMCQDYEVIDKIKHRVNVSVKYDFSTVKRN